MPAAGEGNCFVVATRALFSLFSLVVTTSVLISGEGCSSDTKQTTDPNADAGSDGALVVEGPRPVVCDDAVPLPSDLRCTGLYSDFGAKKISPEARPIAPGISLWSDGAAKSRWLYLPPSTQIDTSDMDEWVFPVGTKVWKEFKLDGKTIETRLFAKKAPFSWVFTTYIWDKDGSAAHRVDTGQPNAAGTYEVPNKVHCSQCHNGHADRLLGIEAITLGLPTAEGLTLTKLKDEGRLSNPPPQTTINLPGDETAQKALGWLHVNCGITCHSPNSAGTAGFTGMLLRLSAKALLAGTVSVTDTDAYKTTVGKPFVSATFLDDPRFAAHKRITANDPDKSLIVAAISERSAVQMPPIVSHKVDDNGILFLRNWITSLP